MRLLGPGEHHGYRLRKPITASTSSLQWHLSYLIRLLVFLLCRITGSMRGLAGTWHSAWAVRDGSGLDGVHRRKTSTTASNSPRSKPPLHCDRLLGCRTGFGLQLHFCLASLNREAPGPQTWRLMSMRPHDDCTTETTTLLVSPSEEWKLHSNDDIVFGDEPRSRSVSLSVGKFLNNSDILARNLSDNIAGGGLLSQSGREVVQGGVVVV